LASVARDEVALTGAGAADEVVCRADVDAVAAVGEGGAAVLGGADAVALDDVAVAAEVHDADAEAAVAGDDVAGPGGADGVARGATGQDHADAGVAQPGRAVRGRADVVAGHDVARGPRAVDPGAGIAVAADDVPLGGVIGPVAVGADEVIPCSAGQD